MYTYCIHILMFFDRKLFSIESLVGFFIISLFVVLVIFSSLNKKWINIIIVNTFLIYNYTFLITLILIHFFFETTVNFVHSTNAIESYFFFDSLSLLFVLMVLYIIPLCLLYTNRQLSLSIRPVALCICWTEFFVLVCFTIRNLFFFYISFELVLIPMFLLIFFYGSRTRRFFASILFFVYTFFGSILLLIAIIFIIINFYTLNFDWFIFFNVSGKLSLLQKYLLFSLFFIGFAVKIPIMPFHTWLPEAHVEAPTVGSVILAAISLKLGGFGILRTLIPLLHDFIISIRYIPLTFCILSCCFAVFVAFHHYDIKKIIAYSSILHMNFSLIGLWTNSKICFIGSIISMIAHSLTSAGLFFIAGFIYEKFHTRNVLYYSHLYKSLDPFYFIVFFFILANMSVPMTLSFLGELLIFIGIGNSFTTLTVICGFIFMLSGIFGCLLLHNLIYSSKLSHIEIIQYQKLNELKLFPTFFNYTYTYNFTLSEFIILILLFLPLLILFFIPFLLIETINNFLLFLI